jgi:ABC-2 type transport system permease protein
MSVETGVIHDIGYQRYTGRRLGRRHILWALYLHGLNAAFGLGRTAKAKVFPWLVIGIVTLVAVIVTAIRSQTGIVAMTYAGFADAMSWLIIFFVAIVAPELVSRDLGAGVLPLYFSRPLRPPDYVVAKLAALVTAVWLLLGGPQLIMFLGGAFTTTAGLGGVWREFTDFLPGFGYAGLWALVFGAIGLLVASLTGRRALAAGGIVAIFLMTTPAVGVLSLMPAPAVRSLAGIASPSTLVAGVGTWLFPDAGTGFPVADYGPVYAGVAVALIDVCIALLLARYRKVASR